MMTLVLLPGLDGTGTLFAPFITALGSDSRVEIVSYPPGEPLDYYDLEEFVRSLLPKEGPFVILGESFSGPIAVSLAASYPTRVKGLILCCSFVRNPHPFASFLSPLLGVVPAASLPVSVLSSVLLGRFSSDALRSALSQAAAQISPAVLNARLRAVADVDVSAELASLRMPVLYLRASDDLVVPRAASEIVSRVKPDARIVQLEAPHCLLQAVPEEAAQVIQAFVSELGEGT